MNTSQAVVAEEATGKAAVRNKGSKLVVLEMAMS
jgi:hypothetical protein